VIDSEYRNAESPYYLNFSIYEDLRGMLKSFDFSELPFQVNRYFAISVKSTDSSRGSHAHRQCWQAFFSCRGSQKIFIKNLGGIDNFQLTGSKLLIIPPYNWCEVRFDSNDSVMGVFASHPYDKEDYLLSEPPLVQ